MSLFRRRLCSLLASGALFTAFLAAGGPAGTPAAHAEETRAAPEFPKRGNWLNLKKLPRNPFKDQVTLVYFFDYATANAIREFEHLKNWHSLYEKAGLQILLVHVPEFQFAYSDKNVARALERFGLSFPVLLDNEAELWEAYGNRSWPTKHLVGPDGNILMSQVGEGEHAKVEAAIREALRDLNPKAKLPEPFMTPEEDYDRFDLWRCGEMSPELYIGYKRAAWWGVGIANRDGVSPEETLNYSDEGRRLERGFFLNGTWANREEYFEHRDELEENRNYLGIIYLGREVYGVLDQLHEGKVSKVYIERDSAPVPEEMQGRDLRQDEGGTYVNVEHPRLYYLISGEDDQYHELKLLTGDEGLAVYMFSFANRCLAELNTGA